MSESSGMTTNVGGTATLAGTVQANFGPGTFLDRSYTILTATGGRRGTFDARHLWSAGRFSDEPDLSRQHCSVEADR
jgi:hypothetical protein